MRETKYSNVTDKQYENFELSWDWKLSKGGNSGMLYHVVERPQFAVPYVTGPEYQLIDEPNFPEPLEEWQKLGVDYAMHLPDKAKKKPRKESGTMQGSYSTTDM
mgnify:CR=1 FL=1